ncbi:hypothetical protein [Nocardia abscessus]|uniref:hypothetical protein n=1 Tax=Nocardia abscessus TaxID=120957 RepID=UPI0002E8DDD8|nr:hypothetical protein [Nocardia abscessus]MCC3333525.1 hypothetical protein [Nocardia abscessus]
MSDNVSHFPGSDLAIRTLHAEIERLASIASQAYISRTPLRIEHTTDSHRSEMQWWHDDNGLKIFTCDGGVYVSSTLQFQYWPDWYALSNQQVRTIANALWSAAAYVEPSSPDSSPQPHPLRSEAARPEPSRDGDLGGPGRATNFP